MLRLTDSALPFPTLFPFSISPHALEQEGSTSLKGHRHPERGTIMLRHDAYADKIDMRLQIRALLVAGHQGVSASGRSEGPGRLRQRGHLCALLHLPAPGKLWIPGIYFTPIALLAMFCSVSGDVHDIEERQCHSVTYS